MGGGIAMHSNVAVNLGLAALCTCPAWPAQAKSDIRGITIGMSKSDVSKTAELDGADCDWTTPDILDCAYGKYGPKAKLTVWFEPGKRHIARRLAYEFSTKDAAKTKASLKTLYQMRGRTFIDDYKLPTGEKLISTFGEGGKVRLTINPAGK